MLRLACPIPNQPLLLLLPLLLAGSSAASPTLPLLSAADAAADTETAARNSRRSVEFPEVDRASLIPQACIIAGSYLAALLLVGLFVMHIRRQRSHREQEALAAAAEKGADHPYRRAPSRGSFVGLGQATMNSTFMEAHSPDSHQPHQQQRWTDRIKKKLGSSPPQSNENSTILSPVTDTGFLEQQNRALGNLFAAAIEDKDSPLSPGPLTQNFSMPRGATPPLSPAFEPSHSARGPSVASSRAEPLVPPSPHLSRSMTPLHKSRTSVLQPQYQSAQSLRSPRLPPPTSPRSPRREQSWTVGPDQNRRTPPRNYSPDDTVPLSPSAAQLAGHSSSEELDSPQHLQRPAQAAPRIRAHRPPPTLGNTGTSAAAGFGALPLRSWNTGNQESGEAAKVAVSYVPKSVPGRLVGRSGDVPLSPYTPRTPITPMMSPVPTRQALRKLRKQYAAECIVESDEDME